jgi:hypothetical protein
MQIRWINYDIKLRGIELCHNSVVVNVLVTLHTVHHVFTLYNTLIATARSRYVLPPMPPGMGSFLPCPPHPRLRHAPTRYARLQVRRWHKVQRGLATVISRIRIRAMLQ